MIVRTYRREAAELSEFVMYAAATTRQLVGFDWLARPKAPGDYRQLQLPAARAA